ncbi:MAG: hypothetical protein Q8P67_17280 [archaeon]|nr:hypothetical protein [archaeon]
MFQNTKHPSIDRESSLHHHHQTLISVITVITAVTMKYLVNPKSLLPR